jgi:dihydropteroate synthase
MTDEPVTPIEPPQDGETPEGRLVAAINAIIDEELETDGWSLDEEDIEAVATKCGVTIVFTTMLPAASAEGE